MQITRDIFFPLIKCLNSAKVLILKGASQVGKTTIMDEIQGLMMN